MAIYSKIFNRFADDLKQEWDAQVYGAFLQTAVATLQAHATPPQETSLEEQEQNNQKLIHKNLGNLGEKAIATYKKEVDFTLTLRESLMNNKTGNQDTYDRYFTFLNQCAQDSLADSKALIQSFEDNENDPQRSRAFNLGNAKLAFNKAAVTKVIQHMVPFTGNGWECDRRAFLDAMIDAHTLTRTYTSKALEHMSDLETLDVKRLFEEYQAETAKIFKRVEKQGEPLTPIKGSSSMIFTA